MTPSVENGSHTEGNPPQVSVMHKSTTVSGFKWETLFILHLNNQHTCCLLFTVTIAVPFIQPANTSDLLHPHLNIPQKHTAKTDTYHGWHYLGLQ